MIRWVVVFKDTEEMLGVRANQKLRDAHVAYAKSHPEPLIGGGLKPDPDSAFCGALWVVEAKTRAQVVELVEHDPFYVSKYRDYEIFTWGSYWRIRRPRSSAAPPINLTALRCGLRHQGG